jgi:hypothetical protein
MGRVMCIETSVSVNDVSMLALIIYFAAITACSTNMRLYVSSHTP